MLTQRRREAEFAERGNVMLNVHKCQLVQLFTNRKSIGLAVLVVLSCAAAMRASGTLAPAEAETSISDVVVNQRWPWSEKVDVDFVLTGETNDVEVTATWDAHPEPYRLGTVFAAAPGQNRLTWDPTKSPFRGQTLTGFTVAVSNVAASAHTYLVLDLVNGGYEFLADAPAGGWTAAHKSSKMVFRRIPAGTYTLGEEKATFTFLGLPDSSATTYASLWNRRTVTFTSDFYVGVFKYTEAQHECLTSGNAGTSFKPKKMSYDSFRGGLDAADWPSKGYTVGSDSVVAKLRSKAGLVIDLCEEEQWEVAARAGTTTILPNGVTTADNYDVLTNKLSDIAAWYGTVGSDEVSVGLFATNNWGLYDVVGLVGEWMLDSAVKQGTGSLPKNSLVNSTDPTGEDLSRWGSEYRIFRTASANYEGAALQNIIPCSRQMAGHSSEYTCSTRFCIHLKPLGGAQ